MTICKALPSFLLELCPSPDYLFIPSFLPALTLPAHFRCCLGQSSQLRQVHRDARWGQHNQNHNKVLQEPAPAVNSNEKSLPRRTRTILAQLRSGYSTHLESYLHRINRTGHPSDICPQCGQEPQTTAHLFNCSANPTTLTTRTLWEDPPAAAAFLDLPTHQDDELDDND